MNFFQVLRKKRVGWKEEVKEYDELWKKNAKRYDWVLPEKSFFFLRLPAIRYIRWFGKNLRVQLWANAWARAGIGMGYPSQYDEWVLWAIYRGWH